MSRMFLGTELRGRPVLMHCVVEGGHCLAFVLGSNFFAFGGQNCFGVERWSEGDERQETMRVQGEGMIIPQDGRSEEGSCRSLCNIDTNTACKTYRRSSMAVVYQ